MKDDKAKKAKRASGEDQTDGMIEKGNQLIQEERLDEAQEYFEKLLQEPGSQADVIHNQIGYIHFKKGNFNEAQTAFEAALKVNPNLTDAYFNLGLLHRYLGDYEQALIALKQALLTGGENWSVFELMGDCTLAMGNKRDAEHFYDAALKLKPDSANAATQLAGIYIEREQWDNALKVLNLALVSHPNNPHFHMALADILKQQGQVEKAIAHYRRAALLDEKNSQAFYQLGECCYEMELYKQAEPFYAQAYKIGQHAEALFRLGEVYEKLRKKDKAMLMYEKWVEIETPQIRFQDDEFQALYRQKCESLAEFHEKKGDFDKAASFRLRIEELDSPNESLPHLFAEKDTRKTLTIDA